MLLYALSNILYCSDIDKTLLLLDHVISYYGVSKEVEPTIKESPSNQGLDVFLHALKRLQEAMLFFEKNNPQSVELENVVLRIAFSLYTFLQLPSLHLLDEPI